MIDNLWIAICFCFTAIIALYCWLYNVDRFTKEVAKQLHKFLEVQILHTQRINERVHVLEKRDRIRRVK
jgi:hypothetical protein